MFLTKTGQEELSLDVLWERKTCDLGNVESKSWKSKKGEMQHNDVSQETNMFYLYIVIQNSF